MEGGRRHFEIHVTEKSQFYGISCGMSIVTYAYIMHCSKSILINKKICPQMWAISVWSDILV